MEGCPTHTNELIRQGVAIRSISLVQMGFYLPDSARFIQYIIGKNGKFSQRSTDDMQNISHYQGLGYFHVQAELLTNETI